MTDESSQEMYFELEPEGAIWALARRLVSGQRAYVQFKRRVDAVRDQPDTPELRKVLDEFAQFERDWVTTIMPGTIAAMQVAVEVFDTFGPGRAEVTGIDGAVWNNKYIVWAKELAAGDGPGR